MDSKKKKNWLNKYLKQESRQDSKAQAAWNIGKYRNIRDPKHNIAGISGMKGVTYTTPEGEDVQWHKYDQPKSKPKKETLTPKQKAAWLRSQRPEKAEISYDDREVNPEAEASNNDIGELMDDLALKTMSIQFESRDHIDEVLEQIKDMRVFVEDHMETYGTDREMMNALDILSMRETKAMNILESRQKGEEAITSRKDL